MRAIRSGQICVPGWHMHMALLHHAHVSTTTISALPSFLCSSHATQLSTLAYAAMLDTMTNNSAVPIRKSGEYTTEADNQPNIEIDVYQGESEMVFAIFLF